MTPKLSELLVETLTDEVSKDRFLHLFSRNPEQYVVFTHAELNKFLNRVLGLVKDQLADTGTQCAYTSYDLGVVECTIARALDQVQAVARELCDPVNPSNSKD